MKSVDFSWPPPYKLRVHRLAKSVKLRALDANELQITVPKRFNVKKIPLILNENKEWILAQLSLLKNTHPPQELPTEIFFYAKQEKWRVTYLPTKNKLRLFVRPNQEIILIGLIDYAVCCKLLKKWLRATATQYLSAEFKKLSETMNLSFNEVRIRDQKTLWGSCTSKKTISLNYKLIFFPKNVMHYIFIHELCHTQYLNHSKKFWDLVAYFDPLWKMHKRELKNANQYLPAWMNNG